jgi:hypothetical protein
MYSRLIRHFMRIILLCELIGAIILFVLSIEPGTGEKKVYIAASVAEYPKVIIVKLEKCGIMILEGLKL